MAKPAVSEVADDVYVVACHPARSSTLLRVSRDPSVEELAAIAEFYPVLRITPIIA